MKPKTLFQVILDAHEGASNEVLSELLVMKARLKHAGLLDALIGAQGRVVYTEETLLAAGQAYEEAHRAALDTNDYEAGLIAGARAAITAAGGVVADKVRTFAVHEKASLKVTKPREVVRIPLKVHPGDILYIVRAKEE